MIPLYDSQPVRRFPTVTLMIIAANIAVFAGWQLQVGLEQSVQLAALVPERLVLHYDSLAGRSIFTSMFMHGGWLHLLGNMWFLWIFGNNVEDETGSLHFLLFYLLCGVAAVATHTAVDPRSAVPLVGASGAVSGVLGAYLMLHPQAKVTTLFFFGFFARVVQIRAVYYLLMWIGLQVLSQALMGRKGIEGIEGGGVAYLAHVGGFVAGILLIFLFRKHPRSVR